MPVEDQVVAIFAGVNGYLDPIPVSAVTHFEERLMAIIKDRNTDILKEIREQQEISEETEKKLKTIIEEFSKTFVSG